MDIKIDNVVENDDGSCNVDLEYDGEALEMATTWAAGQKGIDIKDEDAVMQAFVIDMLENGIKEEEEKAIDADK